MRRSLFACAMLALCFWTVGAPAALVSRLALDGDLLDPISSNNGTLTPAGAATFVDGYDGTPGGALSLNGAQLVSLEHTSGLPLTANPAFSVAMWVKGGLQNDRRVFAHGSSTSNTPLYNIGTHSAGTNGSVDILIRSDANSSVVNHVRSLRNAFDNTWHHIAVVDENGVITLYIDGVREEQQIRYTRPVMTFNRTALGGILRAAAGSFFTGCIDDVQLYDHALSAAEVGALVPDDLPGCPEAGDTTCDGISITGPPGGLLGEYVVSAMNPLDGNAEPIFYTFSADDGAGTVLTRGPLLTNEARFTLLDGNWTVSVTVDDTFLCDDAAGICSQMITVLPEPPELIAHWTFNGTLDDASGNANHGAYVGEATARFATGYDCTRGGATTLDGVDDLVLVTQAHGLPIYNKLKCSIAMWVKGAANQGDRRVFSESFMGMVANNNPLFNIGTHNQGLDGTVDIFIRNDTGTTLVPHLHSTGVAFDGTWHHIAWVDRNGSARLYIDGVLDATNFSYAKQLLTANVTSIGAIQRATSCCWFAGEVDDLRLYNYELSEAEIQELAAAPPPCVNVIAGDCLPDGMLTLADLLCYLRLQFPGFFLFDRSPPRSPCGPDLSTEGSITLLDVNGDGRVNLGDALSLAMFIFGSGGPPVQGTECFTMPETLGCAENEACAI